MVSVCKRNKKDKSRRCYQGGKENPKGHRALPQSQGNNLLPLKKAVNCVLESCSEIIFSAGDGSDPSDRNFAYSYDSHSVILSTLTHVRSEELSGMAATDAA